MRAIVRSVLVWLRPGSVVIAMLGGLWGACGEGRPASPASGPVATPPDVMSIEEERVRAFVFQVAEARVQMPQGIDRAAALRVLRGELTPSMDPPHLENACNVIRLARLHAALPSMHVFLTTAASDAPAALRRLSVVRLFADLGPPLLQREGLRAFEELASEEILRDPSVLREARRTLVHVPRPSAALLRRLLSSRADESRPDMGALLRASELRERLLATEDSAARAQSIADLFLGGEGAEPALREWAGYALAWEAQRSSAAIVIAALRAARVRVTEDAVLRARASVAIRFLGGELSAEERADIKADDLFQP